MMVIVKLLSWQPQMRCVCHQWRWKASSSHVIQTRPGEVLNRSKTKPNSWCHVISYTVKIKCAYHTNSALYDTVGALITLINYSVTSTPTLSYNTPLIWYVATLYFSQCSS